MKKRTILTGAAVLLVSILCGCSSVKWERLSYVTPANEINLKKKAAVKFTAAENRPEINMLVKLIADRFAGSGQFQVDEKNPDYWIVIGSERNFRTDDPKTVVFNRHVEKARQSNQYGGHEFIKVTNHQTSSAAAFVTVAVYSVRDLAPVYYFDTVMYDSDFSTGNIRSQKEYYGEFTRQIIAKFQDSFLVRNRRIETAIPKNADTALKDALSRNDAAGVITAAERCIPEPFDQFMSDVYAGKYKDNDSLMETRLSDYYILALAQEMGSFDIALLKKLHAQHVAILNLTESRGLRIACPNTLARIESKLKLLQTLK